MQGNPLDLSQTNTHTDYNDDTDGKKVINSYEFKMLSDERAVFDR